MPVIKNNINIVSDITYELRRYSTNIRQDVFLDETESNIYKVIEQNTVFKEMQNVISMYNDLLEQEISNIEKVGLKIDEIDKEIGINISGM